jgi:formate hydrogenlyase transcriptional activator
VLTADLAEREKAMIENALREAGGLVSGPAGAAAKLGIPRQTLESKIRKLGIKPVPFQNRVASHLAFWDFSSLPT